jgi:tRNA(Arg) A34 adenosine deaminase TadA
LSRASREDPPQPPLHFPTVALELPAWVGGIVRPGDILADRASRMRLAIRLALENVAHDTGGPFGSAVFERDSGRVVSVGVNVVVPSGCSLAHGEAMALALAQRALGTHDLAAPGLPDMELVTSAQPCCQCFGMVWWSGVRGLIIGARGEDVESIAGFDEGPLPPDWADRLRGRVELPPVDVVRDVLRDEALAPLRAFRDSGKVAYNPGGGA